MDLDPAAVMRRREELVTAAAEALAPIINGASDAEKFAAAGVVAEIVVDALIPLLK